MKILTIGEQVKINDKVYEVELSDEGIQTDYLYLRPTEV
jgi:hypothetical protein